MSEPKLHLIQIRVPAPVYHALKAMGEPEQRSVSAEVRLALLKHTRLTRAGISSGRIFE